MAQRQPPMQATDTFVATMEDGSDHLVTKGQVLPFGHPLVKRDRDGSGTLFRPLDLGAEDEPDEEPKSGPEAKAPQEPVKAPPARAAGKAAARG
jgi:hypothetical protein